MRPEQRFAVDVLLEQAFAQHEAEILACPPPRCVGRLVDDVPQIVQAAGVRRLAVGDPALARLTALPGAGGEAQDLDLDGETLQRAGKDVRADRKSTRLNSSH